MKTDIRAWRSALSGAALLVAMAGAAAAAAEVEIATNEVADGIHMLTGKGGNIGVFIGKDGTFMIDDQFAPLTGKILAAVKSIGGDIPRYLINTHFHGDHTGGNENIGRLGTTLVSHDNVRELLTTGTTVKAFGMVTPPAPECLPVVTFSKDVTFHLNGEIVNVFHVPNAHTDGDSIIHFVRTNVIHAGDVFFNGFYPFIDIGHGGTVSGVIAAADAILARSNNDTKIIPGHGPLASTAELKEYRDMLALARERLEKFKVDGKSAAAAADPVVFRRDAVSSAIPHGGGPCRLGR